MPRDYSKFPVGKAPDGKLGRLRTNLGNAFPLSPTENFEALLAAIDDADESKSGAAIAARLSPEASDNSQ